MNGKNILATVSPKFSMQNVIGVFSVATTFRSWVRIFLIHFGGFSPFKYWLFNTIKGLKPPNNNVCDCIIIHDLKVVATEIKARILIEKLK